jgi:hypothetical protein
MPRRPCPFPTLVEPGLLRDGLVDQPDGICGARSDASAASELNCIKNKTGYVVNRNAIGMSWKIGAAGYGESLLRRGNRSF